MSLKPWREIIVPHQDVLNGPFQKSEFAADITAVRTGRENDSGSGHLKGISTVVHLVFYKHLVLQPVGKMAENPIRVQNRSASPLFQGIANMNVFEYI
jgi:hypothetical protein